MPPRRLPHLDAIAGLAILRVVTIHAKSDFVITGLGQSELLTQQPLGMNVLDTLLRFSVPIFLLLSGVKYGLRREWTGWESYRAYLANRCDRIVRPYWGVSLLVTLLGWISFRVHRSFGLPLVCQSLNHPMDVLGRFLGIDNPAYQLWFLVMLILVSSLYPLLRRSLPWREVRLPVLVGVFLLLTFGSPPYPLGYLRFLLIYELGVEVGRRYRIDGTAGIGWPFRLLAGFLAVAGGALRVVARQGTLCRSGEALIEVFLPVALLLTFERIPEGVFLRSLSWIGSLAWPVYLLHAPFLLGNLGLLFWRGLGWRSPWAILPLAIGSFGLAALMGVGIRRTPLRRWLL